MECIICASPTTYYFSKTYTEKPFDLFMKDIGPVDYHKCGACGFVLSKTHRDLSKSRWEKLNHDLHHYNEDPTTAKSFNQPPYAEQALMLAILNANKIIDMSRALDYAAGYGSLAKILDKYFGIRLPIFDRYVTAIEMSGDDRYVAEPDLGTYKTVINSAMFEHVLSRDHLDEVNALVDSNGVLVLHTLVCENIPKDPNWFYLAPPVHTAFHTNRSMQILMEQWGYAASLYAPHSKCWVLLKKEPINLAQKIAMLNAELQTQWFVYKKGFVDYWKGF